MHLQNKPNARIYRDVVHALQGSGQVQYQAKIAGGALIRRKFQRLSKAFAALFVPENRMFFLHTGTGGLFFPVRGLI